MPGVEQTSRLGEQFLNFLILGWPDLKNTQCQKYTTNKKLLRQASWVHLVRVSRVAQNKIGSN